MLKWRKLIPIVIIILLSLGALKLFVKQDKPTIHSQSAIMIDASTGEVLYEKDSATSYPVASMSKIMTAYVVLDSIENGLINWNDMVLVSETANHLEASAVTMPVQVGDRITVNDLFKAMLISSANNATIALAEHIAGTEEAFTGLMNEKAMNLGLSDQTQFVNTTGLPHFEMNQAENIMPAEDVAILAKNLLHNHGNDILETVNLQHYYIDSYGIDLYNTNTMIGNSDFKGLDGLKTGFTNAAGYCFVGTAVKKDKRLITVIMNADSDEARFIETKKLLSYGFDEIMFPSIKEIAKSLKMNVTNFIIEKQIFE